MVGMNVEIVKKAIIDAGNNGSKASAGTVGAAPSAFLKTRQHDPLFLQRQKVLALYMQTVGPKMQ